LQLGEYRTDVGVVIDADDHLAFYRCGDFCHAFVVVEAERDTVAFSLPVWRGAVEQRVWAVVLADDLLPVEAMAT
jgi:hypothetical protein